MNQEQIDWTQKKFPILFSFAKEYTESDADDIRQAFRDKPILLLGQEYWLKYERALQHLSDDDKKYLLERLRNTTKKLSGEKGWPHFEEVLNEALAYEKLLKDGLKKIRFIDEKENEGIKPDLKILNEDNSLRGLVEVKTTRFSDYEYKAVSEEHKTGKGRWLPMETHPTLYKKITSEIEEAINQIWSYDSTSLFTRRIYLFLNLDNGILMDIIFTPRSDLEEFLCNLKEIAKKGELSRREGKTAELKIYVLSGRNPVELCKNST